MRNASVLALLLLLLLPLCVSGEVTVDLREDRLIVGNDLVARESALAAQLADGIWVESSTDRGVYTSVANWLYSEGKAFSGDLSPEIVLEFGRDR